MSNFVNKVISMYVELKVIPSRKETLEKCVQNRLANSEDIYNEQIRLAYSYLLSRDNLKVAKTIVRENKKKGV